MQKPVFENILVELIEEKKEQVIRGIIIPDSIDTSKPHAKGKVVAVGPGHTENGVTIPVCVSVGNIIMFNKYGQSYEFKEGDKTYLLMPERNIFTIEVDE